MGLAFNEIKFLLWAKQGGVNFARTMMIGRQRLFLNAGWLQAAFSVFGINQSKGAVAAMLAAEGGYAEPFFRYLGAQETSSIDASSYEGASHVLDMNRPIPEDLKGTFSVVLDGGSLEHVFNFPVAIKNCMEMVQLQGHFIGIIPCNNYLGHGFYQFSPELFFRIFTEANGFSLEKIIVYETAPMARWYQVADPDALGERAEIRTRRRTLLIVQARRNAIKPLLATMPQQSDYVAVWHHPASSRAHLSLPDRFKMRLPATLWKLREWARPKIKSQAFQEIRVPPAR